MPGCLRQGEADAKSMTIAKAEWGSRRVGRRPKNGTDTDRGPFDTAAGIAAGGRRNASARSGRSNLSAPSHDLPKTTPATWALACESPGFNEIECAKNISSHRE
jgi:hypothetical protein